MAKKKEVVKKVVKKEVAKEADSAPSVVNHGLGCVDYSSDKFPGKPE